MTQAHPMMRAGPQLDYQLIRITTVDPSQRLVEGVLKDGAPIRVAIWEVPTNFRWPVQGETWSVTRRANHWFLGNAYEDTESEEFPIEDLAPGETKIGSSAIFDRFGNRLASHDEATKTIGWANEDGAWVPKQLGTAAIADSAITPLKTNARRQRVTAVSTVAFTGLSGEVESPYRLIVDGRISNAADHQVRVLLTGVADSSLNGRNSMVETYNNPDDTNQPPQYNESNVDAGLTMGGTRWSLPSDLFVSATIRCRSNSQPASVFSGMTKPYSPVDARVIQWHGAGFLYTPRVVTAMTVDFNGGSFTGDVILVPLSG